MTYDPETTMPTPEQEHAATVRWMIAHRLPADRRALLALGSN